MCGQRVLKWWNEFKEEPERVTAFATVGLFLATVVLAIATGFLWAATQDMAQTSESQKDIAAKQNEISQRILEIEGFKADYLRPQPTCTWVHRNNTVELLVSNTGSNAFLIGKVSMNATYLVEGYYGIINRSLTFTTGSHPVVSSESNRRYRILEQKIPITIGEDQTTVDGVANVREVSINISAGKPQFNLGKYMGKVECHSVPSLFLSSVS